MNGIDMNEGSFDGASTRMRGARTWARAAVVVSMGLAAGCEIDCDQRYCDFVRAAAGGIYAWEYECCLDPDSPACVDRAIRYQALAFGGPAMRMACEEANWDRVGEIWDEVRRAIPAVPLRIILRSFCGIDAAFGENVATPFMSGDSATIDVVLAPVGSIAVPSEDHASAWRRSDPTTTVITRSMENRSNWVVQAGSEVRIRWGGSTAGFDVTGVLSVVESAIGGEDLDDWCRRLRPEELRLLLRGPDGTIQIGLDPTFEGNAMAFSDPDAGTIGVAVRIGIELEGAELQAIPFESEPAFLTVPFRIDPDGGLRLGSDLVIDAFDLWPVDPRVEAYLSGTETTAGDEDQAACAMAARVVADHFLSLHASECDGFR